MALRALVAAHAQSSWNRATRRLSRRARIISVGLLLFFGSLAMLSFSAFAMGGGFLCADDWEKRRSIAALLLFTATWGVGTLFGLTGGGRLLEAGQLRQFPVRSVTVFFAELAARLAEPLTFVLAIALVAFHIGLGIGRPALIPVLPLLFVVQLFVFLASQFALSELVGALARRLRIAFGVLVVIALGLTPRAGLVLKGGFSLKRFEHLDVILQWLPSTWLVEAMHCATSGDGVRVPRLVAQGLVPPLLLMGLGIWVMGREQSARAAPVAERESGLWTFSSPLYGIARLHLSTVFRTPTGRYSLIAPLFAMILVPGLMQVLFGVQRASLAVFSYAALGAVQFHVNLLGFDGASMGELFRLPITSRAILGGKQVAVLTLALVEGAVLAVFLRIGRDESLDGCALGLCLFLSINLLMGALGRFVSVQWPRALPKRGMRSVPPPLPVILINLFGTLSLGGGLGLLHWALQRTFGAWSVVWALGILLASAAASALSLDAAAEFLEERRERVLLAMK